MNVLIFYATIVEKCLILRKIQRDIIINVPSFFFRKVSVILVRC